MYQYNYINFWRFKFNLAINITSSTWFVIYFNATFCSKFTWLIWCILWQIYFLIFYYYTIIICLRLSTVFCLSFIYIYIYIYIYIISFFSYFFILLWTIFFYFSLSLLTIFCLSSGETYLYSVLRYFFIMLICHCFWIFWKICVFISNCITDQTLFAFAVAEWLLLKKF